MERELGVAGRLLGLGVLDNLLPLLWETAAGALPARRAPCSTSPTGVIVHSRYVERARARGAGTTGRLWRIPHPAWPREPRRAARTSQGDPLVGCFGNLNMNKRIPQLLEAFALLRRAAARARGCCSSARRRERFDLERRLERLGLGGEALIREDYVPEERLWSLMAACDVLVNLRSPTMGETSGAVIRGLSLGKPMLVSDVGWFAELPDDVALKSRSTSYEVRDDRGRARARGRPQATSSARRRASTCAREHDLGRVADAYARALEEAAGGDAVDDAVLWRIAEAAAEVGIDDVASSRAGARAGSSRELAR